MGNATIFRVDINIQQLPIPAWGLTCPKCGYSLNGLPRHRCPECGVQFDMCDVVPTWARLREPTYTGHELPFPDFGIRCERCRQPLAGVTSDQCASCLHAFDPKSFRPTAPWFSSTFHNNSEWGHAAATALEVHQIPFIRREPVRAFSITPHSIIYIPSEYCFDFMFAIREAQHQSQGNTDRAASIEWRCQACNEKNPETFDLCWNCGNERVR